MSAYSGYLSRGVTPELQHAIRENTFEVVMKKPEKDPITYEKPLPLDLIPFIERTDAYRSVGTAFSLGSKRNRSAIRLECQCADLWRERYSIVRLRPQKPAWFHTCL